MKLLLHDGTSIEDKKKKTLGDIRNIIGKFIPDQQKIKKAREESSKQFSKGIKELGTQILEFGAGKIFDEEREEFRRLPLRRQIGESIVGAMNATLPMSTGGAIPKFAPSLKGAVGGSGIGAIMELLLQEKPTVQSVTTSPSTLLGGILGGIHGEPIVKKLGSDNRGFIKIPGIEKMQ